MNTSAMPLVVISVLSWNTCGRTLRCLQALRQLDYPNFKVVLVDNASSDASVQHVRAQFPAVTILEQTDNRGFAEGHAGAWQLAKKWQAAAIWLVNSDAEVEPTALSELVNAWLMHGEAVYGAIPLHQRMDGTVIINFPHRYFQPEMQLRAFQRDAVITHDQSWRGLAPFPVAAVAGSCLFLPLSVADRYGWLDSCWFLYCEELHYCLRLRELGVRSMVVPQARVWHSGAGSQRGRRHVMDCIRYYQTRNEIVLYRRFGGRLTAGWIVLKKLVWAGCIAGSRWSRARLMLLGVRDALAGRMGKRHAPEMALAADLQAVKTAGEAELDDDAR